MAAYVIDTNIAIGLRDRDVAMIRRVAGLGEDVLLSIVSRVELEGGVYRDPARAASRRQRLDLTLASLQVLPFDERAAAAYGAIVKTSGYSRRKILDRMIAAQALVADATLVTLNAADFSDIPGLKLLAW